jgi:hypothetical protein
LDIFRLQAGEAGQDFVAVSPAARLASTVRRATRVPSNTGSPPADLGVPDDAFFVVLQIAPHAVVRDDAVDFAWVIISL